MLYLAFCFFSLLSIGAAVFLLLTKNILYAAYSLLVCLLGVAAIFALLGADFLAVSQIMVYVGGILVLIIFGIMLTPKKAKTQIPLFIENKNHFWGLGVATVFSVFLIKLVLSGRFVITEQLPQQGSTLNGMGVGLLTNHILSFEIIGLLLLVALIGALYLADKKEISVQVKS